MAIIKKHFAEFPNAADTAEGITSWWLAREQPGVTTGLVERALQSLVESGFVRAVRTMDGTLIYALSKVDG